MAKKAKETTFIDIDKIISNTFEDLIDLSKTDTKVRSWIDSGVYSYNYICSKNLFGAYPVGRVSSIDGLTSTGKSLMVATAMKDPQIDYILIVETEGGGNSQELLEFAGVDTSKVRILKANTFGNYKINKSTSAIEEVNDNKFPSKKTEDDKFIYKEGATRKIRRFVNAIEFNDIKKTILLIVDSFGNLSSVREFSGTPDMGAKPQNVASFFRSFDVAFERTNIAFIFTNKLYTNIGNVYDPFKVSGGVNVEYNPSLSIRLTPTVETDDVAEKDMKVEKERRKTALGSSLKTIRAKIQKSRFGTEYRQIPFLLDFAIGPVRYSGLFTLLKDFDVIKKVSKSYYKIEGLFNDKNFYKKNFVGLMIENGEIPERARLQKIQKLLDEKEIEIKNNKKSVQAQIENINEIEGEEDQGIIDEEDFMQLKKEMAHDVEK